jgi:hypothetical protein
MDPFVGGYRENAVEWKGLALVISIGRLRFQEFRFFASRDEGIEEGDDSASTFIDIRVVQLIRAFGRAGGSAILDEVGDAFPFEGNAFRSDNDLEGITRLVLRRRNRHLQALGGR